MGLNGRFIDLSQSTTLDKPLRQKTLMAGRGGVCARLQAALESSMIRLLKTITEECPGYYVFWLKGRERGALAKSLSPPPRRATFEDQIDVCIKISKSGPPSFTGPLYRLLTRSHSRPGKKIVARMNHPLPW